MFFSPNAIEVLFAPGRMRRALRIRKKRVKFCLLSSIPAARIFPLYAVAAGRPAMAGGVA